MRQTIRRRPFWGIAAVAVFAAASGILWQTGDEIAAVGQPQESISALQQQSEAFKWVAEKATPAVVFIEVEKTVEMNERQMMPFRGTPEMPERFGPDLFRRFFGPEGPQGEGPFGPEGPQGQPQEPFRQRGSGSGFLISADGYILTNNHVVGGADEVNVRMDDGREFEAKVIGTDPDTDVAIIKIDGQNLPFLELADSDQVDVGQWVLAIGSPFGLNHTVTAGIVSATGRNRVGMMEFEDFIQTDAAINPGNSGGPLVDLHARAVGVNTLIYSRTGGNMGIGFTIPINLAKWVKDQIITHGEVTRGYLGVWLQDLDPDLAASFGMEKDRRGALIGDVIADSPAEDAGLKQGDVVVDMNGAIVSDASAFRNRVAMLAPGEDINLKVLRDGSERNLAVEIGKRPAEMDSPRANRAAPNFEDLGLGVQELTPEIAQQLGFEDEEGVIVTRVRQNSAAADAGIQRGNLIQQVNREAVSNVSEFRAALEKSPDDRPVSLLVTDARGSRFVALKRD